MVPPKIALAFVELTVVELVGPAPGSTRMLLPKASETALSAQNLDAAAFAVCAIATCGNASAAAKAAAAMGKVALRKMPLCALGRFENGISIMPALCGMK
jgi:hypothetical protein